MKILMAIGGSSQSEKALKLGAELIRCADETPAVLTVARRKQDRPRAEALLQHAQALLADVPCTVETRLRYGQPAEQIVAEAREGGFGLIILGEPQSRTLKALLLGSTVLHVVEHTICPVIIAKGEIKPIRRILLCDSGVTPSLLGRFTAQLADTLLGEEEITVLHVMSQITAWPGVSDEDLQASAEELIEEHAPEGEWLARNLEALSLPDIHATPKVRRGGVLDEILAESQENDYDLVVIGAHRDAGWQRVLLADIARELIKRLDRPVLVVR